MKFPFATPAAWNDMMSTMTSMLDPYVKMLHTIWPMNDNRYSIEKVKKTQAFLSLYWEDGDVWCKKQQANRNANLDVGVHTPDGEVAC